MHYLDLDIHKLALIARVRVALFKLIRIQVQNVVLTFQPMSLAPLGPP